jgi:ADP-ribosylglycohydrolase
MTPPPGFGRAHPGVPAGTYSDDGAQALCLLASLLACQRLDVDDLGRRLCDWYERGVYAVDGDVFDVGTQTLAALRALRRGVPAIEAGPCGENDNGNGSLMRVLPLALWHRGGDAELVRDADRQSRITHGHARARVACSLYCLWARRILEGTVDAWSAAVTALRSLLTPGSLEENVLEHHIRPDAKPAGRGTGYVIDTLLSARSALSKGRYECAVRAAIALGHDTDTTACVTGGLAGVRDGMAAVPERWRQMLRGGEIFEPLLAGLLSSAG